MKKIVMLALAFTAAMTVSAQLLCADKGKVFLYKQVDFSEKTPEESVVKYTVLDVQDVDGKQTVRMEAVNSDPNNPFGETKVYSTYIYDPATDVTQFIPMTGDDLKTMIISAISEAGRVSNQHLSEQELRDMEKMMSTKGELSLTIDPKWEVDTKIPKSSLRLNAGQMTMVMNLWEGKYLGIESVTTEAGTFECAKVSYVLASTGPNGGQKEYVTEWYAKGVGLVKCIKADKKGKVLSEETLFVIK